MLTGFVTGTSTAVAATPGIKIDVLHNDSVVEEGTVVPEDEDLLLRVQYDAALDIAGAEVVVTLPRNVKVSSDLPGNEAIEEIVNNDDGTITIRFSDPIPSDVTEGALGIQLRAQHVDENEPAPITWRIGEDEGGVTVIIEDRVDPPAEVTDRYSKSVTPSNLNKFVNPPSYTEGEFVFNGLKPEIKDAVLTYTLVMDSADARSGYTIQDTLPAGLGYVANSFTADLTRYDLEETSSYPIEPTIDGSTFSLTVAVPQRSRLLITYEVVVTDVTLLEAELAEKFDELNGRPQGYSVPLKNTANFGEDREESATVTIGGSIPGVGAGNAFRKDGNWTHREVVADEAGNLEPPAEITYALRANLTLWNGENPNFTLGQNVVISDTLPEQAEWMTDDADFINSEGIALTQAAECPAAETDFTAAEFVGQWCVNGQTLLANVGHDNTTNATIHVKAQLNTVAGLPKEGKTTIRDAISYLWKNTAEFHYRDGGPEKDEHSSYPIVLPEDHEDGINDSGVFMKAGPDSEVRVRPGGTAELPYRFTIDTSKKNIDPLKSRIVDEINTEVFDISDPQSVPVSGSYGSQTLGMEHFTVSVDGAGNLVIELSDAGKALVQSLPEDQKWVVDIILTTVPFDGKETFEIYNKATLYGSDEDRDYWDDDDAEATSFGDEAEMRKRLFDPETGEWVAELDAEIVDGEYVNEAFVYSIELIPRGNYGADFPVQVFTREDVLPEELEFLGFVSLNEEGLPITDQLLDGPIEMNGNIVSSFSDGVVTIRQKEGTNLDRGGERIVTYFVVRTADGTEPVVNTIAGSEAIINPVGDPSIDIEKWNDEGATPEYDDTGALVNEGFKGDFDEAPGKPLAAGEPVGINFTVSNDGREDLVDVQISDQLTDGSGEIEDLNCLFPDESTGTTWDGPFLIGTQFDCTGTLLGLESGAHHANTAEVTATGILTGNVVDDEDDWHGYVPVPNIDIEKWNDEGSVPEYDEAGVLLNDRFAGDFDEAPGKPLQVNAPHEINFTISNDGEEGLVNVQVTDELIDGVGEIQDLLCVFPDESEGIKWDGPFAVGTQFDCTGTLPALSADDIHVDSAKVVGAGIHSGTVVDDADDWHGYVPVPSIDIEKWTDEGVTPEYDESGALVNDGFEGDFDEGPGKELAAGKGQKIRFTVSNDGAESLIDVVVTDKLIDGKGHIADLECIFPDGTRGTIWPGPFAVGVQFDCTGMLPALESGDTHLDTASATGFGIHSGIGATDADDWHGFVPAEPAATASPGALAATGQSIAWFTALSALVALILGGGALILGRRLNLGS